MEFFDKDRKFMVGQKNQTKYNTLYSLPISIIVPSNVAISSTSSNDNLQIIHERFCHIAPRTLDRMARNQIVNELPNKLEGSIGYCESYIKGKMTDGCY